MAQGPKMETAMTVTPCSAGAACTANLIPSEGRTPQQSWAPRRRGSRLTLSIAVELYGQGLDGKIFRQETHTRVVSEYGALVSLSKEVALGQTIVLVCKTNGQEMRCRVVSQDDEHGEFHVGIAFLSSAPRFWGVHFPPPMPGPKPA
jgi:PilZ domain